MSWCTAELPPLDRAYHDEEWGIPVHDDRRQFEYVSLDGNRGIDMSKVTRNKNFDMPGTF